MELLSLKNKSINDLTMIDVATAVLEENEDVMHFNDILNEVSDYLSLSDKEIEKQMTRFYSDLNTEGSFISVGSNQWGLRRWYPIDSINEAVTVKNDDDDLNPHIAPEGFNEMFEEDDKMTPDNVGAVPALDNDLEDADIAEEEANAEIEEYQSELSELEIEDEADLDDDEDISGIDEELDDDDEKLDEEE